MALVNDFSPMTLGQTDPPAHWQFQDKLGNIIPLDVGTTFQLLIYNAKNNQTIIGTGTWNATSTQLALGQADYNWVAADTTTFGVGSYYIKAKYTRPNGNIGYTDALPWVVNPIFIQQ